jgi:AraC-like DNA-binding protein
MLAAARAAIMADLTRNWTLSLLAGQLLTSERTLQRRLGEAGAGIAALVRSVRVEAAGRMLIKTDHSLAKIGFAYGFSDQPHFNALFKRQTALTPAAYRKAFA